jgi:hypothetical protein
LRPKILEFCPESANSVLVRAGNEQGILWKSLETQTNKALDAIFPRTQKIIREITAIDHAFGAVVGS